MTLEERIKIIEDTSSFDEIPLDVLPPSHKDNYYFVSYSHKDYKTVFPDILRLEALGINIWYDNEMHIGENWREIAQLYISKFQCSGVIFYLTENSISSPACNQEVEYVLTHNKNFLSINKPLDGCGLQSGYSMLKELQKRGLSCEQSLLDNFEKAFSNEVLYLGINESIEKKAHQISSIQREDLLQLETKTSWRTNKTELAVTACRDNTIINLDLSKIHDCESVSDNISEIGDCVFTNSIKLQSVKVSSKLNKVGESAFRNCVSLTDFDISHVNQIEFGKNSFKNCPMLTTMDLSKATLIDEGAFADCKLLDVKEINGEIRQDAFQNTSITDVDYIAESPIIKRHAFWGCKSLRSFNIKGIFTNDLEDSAFYSCENLENAGPFIAPNVIRNNNDAALKIGAYAFNDCESLKNIKFAGAWDTAGAIGAFWSCNSLETIDLDTKSTKVPSCFARGCKNLKEITNSERFTYIDEEAFEDCERLVSFDLTNVKHVGKGAFAGAGLTRVYLKNINTIEKSAFANCRNLKSVYVGNDCEKIEQYAFLGCNELKVVKILAENVKMSSEVFLYTKGIKVFYLRSKAIFDVLVEDGLLDTLSTLYIGDNLDPTTFNLEEFDMVESDEGSFYKFVAKEKEAFVDPEDEIYITSSEINEPDPFSPKYQYENEDAFVALIAKDVQIKHRRLKKPQVYFVEQIELFNDEMTIDYLVVSTHTGKSFVLDGTLIESITIAQKTIGDWFKIDNTEELNERSCCIVANEDFHYCTVKIVKCNPIPILDANVNFKYAVETIIYVEDDEIKAVSGIDIESIIIFNDDFETEKIIERTDFKPL